MLKRLKSCFTFASFAMLLTLCGLWVSGRVVILRTVRFADSRSHLYIHQGAIQLDCTGSADSLRDLRYCQSIELSLGHLTDLPAHELAITSADNMWTFRAIGRYVMRTPLQEMLDSEGKQIYSEQSLPMRLFTLPAWLVIAVLCVMPLIAVSRWIRQPRGERRWCNPITIITRRYVTIAIVLSVTIVLLWWAGQLRLIRVVSAVDENNKFCQLAFGGSQVVFERGQSPSWYWQRQLLGPAGLRVEQQDRGKQRQAWIGAITFGEMRMVDVPYWLLLTCALAVPLTALQLRLWGKRLRPGHCVDCDYDLRASIGRCPECGREIDAVAPRIVKPIRQQIVMFWGAATLFLGTCVLIVAWRESMSSPCVLFEVLRKASSAHLAIESGNVVITAASASAGAAQSPLPVWPFVVVLAGASGGLLWAGRRIGRAQERH